MSNYFDRLLIANKQKKIYNQDKLKMELDFMWCQKAFRRFKLLKKTDMLFSSRTLRILKPGLLKYTIDNKKRTADYVNAVREFQMKQQAKYIQP